MADMVDEPYSFEDFGKDQAFSVEDMAPPISDFMESSAEDYNSVAFDQDPVQVAQTMAGGPRGYANFIVDQVGDRSNIRNAVNYDPLYAQALNISRGYLPNNQVIGFYPTANEFQGQQDLTIPMDMRPTISGEAGKFGPQYHSGLEKFLQEDITNLANTIGIGPLINTLKGYGGNIKDKFSNLVEPLNSGMDYVKNSTAGLSLKDIKDNLVQNVIASKYNPFTETGPYQAGDFPEGYNLVPEKRVEIGDKELPIPTTYIDDLPQYLNTGIASIKPTAMAEARESMIDREQLIPPIFDYDYGYNDPKTKDLGYGIKTTDNKDELPLLKENVIDLRQEQYNKLADPLFVVNPGNFRPEVKNPYTFGSMGPEEFTFVNVGDA